MQCHTIKITKKLSIYNRFKNKQLRLVYYRFSYAFSILFSVTSDNCKAVCECLVQVFSLVGISSVITSDQGSCFTAQLTQEFMKLFGCNPRWSSPLQPEGNSLVERLNQTLKKLLHHVVRNYGKKWWKMLPHVLWCIRQSKNETLGVSPYMMAFGRLPSNLLKLLKDSWTENGDILLVPGKSTMEF